MDNDDFFAPIKLGPQHGIYFGFDKNVLPMSDKRNLKVLSRVERRIYFKYLKTLTAEQRRTRVINLNREINELDADETPLKDKDGKPPVVKKILLAALRMVHNADQNSGQKEKLQRYALIKRIEPVDEIELTEEEIKAVKERVSKCFLNVPLIGAMFDILDGK